MDGDGYHALSLEGEPHYCAYSIGDITETVGTMLPGVVIGWRKERIPHGVKTHLLSAVSLLETDFNYAGQLASGVPRSGTSMPAGISTM